MNPARMALLSLVLVWIACACTSCREEEAAEAAKIPRLGDFQPYVLAVMKTYPTDGTHGYHWPKTGSWLGITRTLRYADQVVGEGDPKGRCHCSGLTFEVFLRAWERWCKASGVPYRILDLDLAGVKRLQKAWFGTSGDRATLHTAITKNGLGVAVVDWEKAQPGDFVQLWRHSGSGHSCIFRGWVREEKRIVGLRYWSTQGSTHGIGEREERFGDEGSSVKRDEFYVVRVGDAKRPAVEERPDR